MTVKEIRNALMSLDEVKFTVKGINDSINDSMFKMIVKDDDGVNCGVVRMFDQMNVGKFGPTCMTLYTFNMLDKKIVGKIKFADVTLISHVVTKVVDDVTGQVEQSTIEF